MGLRLNYLIFVLILSGMFFISCTKQDGHKAKCEGDSLAVLSFNIRYGNADDGENHWKYRKPILLDFLKQHPADLIGTQEALHFQLQEISEAFPAYSYIGVGRDDGDTLGEYSAIIFKQDKFRVLDSGTFWLSDHPDSVASIDWGNACTRICTWAIFELKQSGKRIALYNLHLDHISQVSREKSTKLVKERIGEVREDIPVLITGDFNAGETNEAVLNLLEQGQNSDDRIFFDSYRIMHPNTMPAGTFNGFKGEKSGEKIDYVLTENSVKVMDAQILYFSIEGRYPSDHFPVYSKICF